MSKKLVPASTNLRKEVNQVVEEYCRKRRVSKSLAIADAVEFAFMPEYREERDAAIIKRLNRLEASYRRHRELTVRDLVIIREMLGTFIKVWFSNTPEVPQEHKKAATRIGEARFEKFLDLLEKNLTGEHSTTMGLVELADIDDEELEELAEENEREG